MSYLKFLFLISISSIQSSLLFSQKMQLVSNNITISITLKNFRNEIYQSWRIINKNNSPIYIPSIKSDSIAPKYEAARIGNEILVSVGNETLVNGIPLEASSALLKLGQNDTLNFNVQFNDTRFKAPINKSFYNIFTKNISFDYLTEEDLKKISGPNTSLNEIYGREYTRFAKHIRFEFSYTCF